jgi:hypothetical protein
VREVFTSQDFTQVGYYKSILDEAGISSFIRNENGGNPMMSGAMFLPALCIVQDADYDEAVRILKSRQFQETAGGADWACPACSEKNPSNFELCWNCNSPRPNV